MQGRRDTPFAYDSFIRVNPRKKRKGKAAGHAITPSDLLTRAKEELLSTEGGWSQGCQEIFHEALRRACVIPRNVLCLGLGSPSSSRDASAQLAFLSHLCTFSVTSPIDYADVSVYDPVFTDADVQLIETLGMRCLNHDQGAEHALNCPTILYMPHCDLKLYEMVIRANWTFEGLCRIVFVANHFKDYIDNNVTSKLEKESPCLAKLAPFMECRALPTSRVFPSAFNNLSVQYVSRTSLSLQGDTFWDIPLFSNRNV